MPPISAQSAGTPAGGNATACLGGELVREALLPMARLLSASAPDHHRSGTGLPHWSSRGQRRSAEEAPTSAQRGRNRVTIPAMQHA